MPYNVIILSSTVMALAFGSVFNLLVRRFVALEQNEVIVGNRVRRLLLWLITSIKARIGKMKEGVLVKGVKDGNVQNGEGVDAATKKE
jgi:GPI-anchor transamidase subunit T